MILFLSLYRFAPDFSYGAPEPSYGAPEPAEPAYAEPAQEYTSPAYTAEGSTELDIGSLLLPILVIVGKSLTLLSYLQCSRV